MSPVPTEAPVRLGERLIQARRISSEQLSMALAVQKRTGQLIGQILIDLGYVSEDDLARALAGQAGTPFVALATTHVPDEVVRLIDEKLARQYHVVPIDVRGKKLRLAMRDPFDVVAIDAVRDATGLTVVPCCAASSSVVGALDRVYRTEAQFNDDLEACIERAQAHRFESDDINDAAEAAPVVALVNAMVARSARERATDIHIEPEAQVVQVRVRIDGRLRQLATLPKLLQQQVIARVKVMANLNITEQRAPQDGKIAFDLGPRRLDLRVSTMLTNFGENVVIRLLDRGGGIAAISHLGFSQRNLEAFTRAIAAPTGLILLTGPTGSGKTTTLYAALGELNAVDVNVMTLEDPIEYEVPHVRQSQINPKAGVTYASGLRAILRQDPDVILVGEMRDQETAEMALRAALTGHLVLSTLHTNSAAAAIPRLIDLGAKPMLLASSLVCVVAQRLVRRLCNACKRPGTLEGLAHAERLSLVAKRVGLPVRVLEARGCDKCSGSGFYGRVAVHEVLEITPELRRVLQWEPRQIEEACAAADHPSLFEDGLEKVLRGVTSLAELERHLDVGPVS